MGRNAASRRAIWNSTIKNYNKIEKITYNLLSFFVILLRVFVCVTSSYQILMDNSGSLSS